MKEKMKSIKTSCQALKPDGSHCQAAALPGSKFCFFHDPALAAERRAAQSAGGSRIKTLDANTPDVKIVNFQDVVALISETINQVRKGQVDPRVANAVGYLANVLIKAVEQGELESRLAQLESAIKGQRSSYELTGTYS